MFGLHRFIDRVTTGWSADPGSPYLASSPPALPPHVQLLNRRVSLEERRGRRKDGTIDFVMIVNRFERKGPLADATRTSFSSTSSASSASAKGKDEPKRQKRAVIPCIPSALASNDAGAGSTVSGGDTGGAPAVGIAAAAGAAVGGPGCQITSSSTSSASSVSGKGKGKPKRQKGMLKPAIPVTLAPVGTDAGSTTGGSGTGAAPAVGIAAAAGAVVGGPGRQFTPSEEVARFRKLEWVVYVCCGFFASCVKTMREVSFLHNFAPSMVE